MRILVKAPPAGATRCMEELETVPEATIGELKMRLAEMFQIPAPQQRLLHKGKLVGEGDDACTLAAEAIADGSVLHLFARQPRHRPTE